MVVAARFTPIITITADMTAPVLASAVYYLALLPTVYGE